MISTETFHAARRLAQRLEDASASKRDAVFRFMAAWPGADRLAAKYNSNGQFNWWELDLVARLAAYVHSADCVAAVVDMLLDGVHNEIANALDALPSSVRDSGSALIWRRFGQIEGVSGLWKPGSPVFRYGEGQWRVLKVFEPTPDSAYAAAYRLLRNRGVSEAEISLLLRKALYFRKEQTIPNEARTVCQDDK